MIDITRITPRQKLIIETGLLEYRYVIWNEKVVVLGKL